MNFLIRTGFGRMKAAICTWPTAYEWMGCGIIALVYLAIALPFANPGVFRGIGADSQNGVNFVLIAAGLFFVPALFEELVFRGLLVPRDNESMPALYRLFQLLGALALFVFWHPLQAMLWAPERVAFLEGGVLGSLALFGFAATFIYAYGQSIWPVVLFHWAIVVAGYAWQMSAG